MNLLSILAARQVVAGLSSDTVEDLFREMVGSPATEGLVSDRGKTVSALLDRERAASTGIGGSVAVPHALLEELGEIVLIVGLSKSGVDFHSGDGKKVNCVFLLLSPPGRQEQRLKLLARISRLTKVDGFCDGLVSLDSAEEVIEAIGSAEKRFC